MLSPNTDTNQKEQLEQDFKKAISAAKLRLFEKTNSRGERNIFFASLVLSLKHEMSWDISTACTDGTTVKYNPKFFMSLTQEQRTFIVLHETLHVAYFHLIRGKDKNPQKWNAAGDYVINDHLIKQGYSMPVGGLHNPKYSDMSTEEVYKALPTEIQIPWEDLDTSNIKDKEEHQQEVENILVRAAIQAESAGQNIGDLPGDLLRKIKELRDPKLPWYQLLRRYMNQTKKEDYSWHKPNKRYIPDFYLPSLYSEGMGELVIAIDVSGSVSDEDFIIFISEVASILKTLKPASITIIQFDTVITNISKVKDIKELAKVKFTGGGGTDIKEVLNWVNEHNPQVVIWLTDGHFYQHPITNKVPTFWVIYNNPTFTYSFGKVIHYELKT